MRLAVLGVFVFGLPALAFAQSPCEPQRVSFDPYKPSDLAVLRQLGSSALAHAPVSALLKLDPYVPSQAQLLREYGGAIPVWPYAWSPGFAAPHPPDCRGVEESSPASEAPVEPAAPPVTRLADVLTTIEQARTAPPAMPAQASTVLSLPAARNTGVSIVYAGRTWVSAGRAVAFDEAAFERIGESGGGPVFRRQGAQDDVIYVPTTRRVVAPFRATSK